MPSIASTTDARRDPRRAVEIHLYVRSGCETCERTIESLMAVLDEYAPDDIALSIRNVDDVSQAELDDDDVITTPTIRMRRPLPLWFVGELRDRRWLRTVLDTVGARRQGSSWRRH